jgi:hypothetical protein
MFPHRDRDKNSYVLSSILSTLNQIKEILMSAQSDLDVGLQAVTDAVNKLGADLTVTLTDLANKIAAGAKPADLSVEIASAKKIADQLTALDAQSVAADQK